MGPETAWFILVIFPAEVQRRSMVVGPYLDKEHVEFALSNEGSAKLDELTEGLPCDMLGMELACDRNESDLLVPQITPGG